VSDVESSAPDQPGCFRDAGELAALIIRLTSAGGRSRLPTTSLLMAMLLRTGAAGHKSIRGSEKGRDL